MTTLQKINNISQETTFPKKDVDKILKKESNDATGNCLFNSIGELLFADQHYDRKIRQKVKQFYDRFDPDLAKYTEDTIEYMIAISMLGDDTDDDGRLHKDTIGQNLVYANVTDALICSLLLKCNIILVEKISSTTYKMTPLGKSPNHKNTIHILYNGVDHFEAMIPMVEDPRIIGLKIKEYFTEDKKWHNGVVKYFNMNKKDSANKFLYMVEFDDGDLVGRTEYQILYLNQGENPENVLEINTASSSSSSSTITQINHAKMPTSSPVKSLHKFKSASPLSQSSMSSVSSTGSLDSIINKPYDKQLILRSMINQIDYDHSLPPWKIKKLKRTIKIFKNKKNKTRKTKHKK
jgi:hypothetical protein